MKPVADFKSKQVRYLFTDIDDTITDHGKLRDGPYQALWKLNECGIAVIPVTGRPAGWCELIARFWPVHGVVGENGGFYFRYLESERRMHRHFVFDDVTRERNQKNLERIKAQILSEVPGCAIASDQFSRLMDLAVDFAEDVGPLPESSVDQIVRIFQTHGAQAKVSSIHVNGWFGDYDKLSTCREYARLELGFDLNTANETCAFSGDSPNDEPMFGFFENSFAVANIKNFLPRLKHRPAFVTEKNGGEGFIEIAEQLIKSRKS